MERKKKAATESGVLLFVAFAILIAVNALSYFMYVRKDMTKTEKYTLSNGSKHLIREMKGEMKVEAYVTRGLPQLDAFVRDLRDLLQQYKESSGGKFDYTLIEPKTEDDKKKARDAQLQELQLAEGSDTEDKAEVAKGFMGLVFKYGTESDKIAYIPPNENSGLEFWITNKIRELKDKGDNTKHKIGVLTGHDEIKLTDANLLPSNMGQRATIQGIITQYFPFYTLVDVDLKNGDAEIDTALDGLLVTQPGKDLTEKELRRIDQFVMKGKSLAIVASAVNVKAGDASMNAKIETHGLEKLLDGYGIEMRKDALLEFGRPFRVSMDTMTGRRTAIFPQFLLVRDDPRFTGDEQLLDTSFAAFFRIPESSFPFASSLVLHRDKQPDIAADKFRVVARTTPAAMRETGDSIDLKPVRQWRPKGEFAQYNLGVTIEGKMKTAFPAGDKMGVEAPAQAEQTARVLVLSSSQFFANPFARAGNAPEMPNMPGMPPMGGDQLLEQLAGPYAQAIITPVILQTKNLCDWLTGDVDLLAASAKILQEPMLAFGDVSKPKFDEMTEDQLKKEEDRIKTERKRTQNAIGITLTLGVPAIFVLFGVFMWRRRLSARENVQLA